MTFRNEMDIEDLLARASRVEALEVYARFLADWVTIVNQHTDGWAYWSAGNKAGCKVADCIERHLAGQYVTAAEWSKAIGAVKSAATRQKIPVPVLGG